MSKKRKAAVWIISALIVLTLGFIWANSCFTQQQSVEESQAAQTALQTIIDRVLGKDTVSLTHDIVRTLAHFSEFLALGIEFALLFIALKAESYKNYLTMLPFGLYVSVIDETIQIFSKRSPEVIDILVDYCGYLTGIAVFFVIFCIRRAIKKRKTAEKEV